MNFISFYSDGGVLMRDFFYFLGRNVPLFGLIIVVVLTFNCFIGYDHKLEETTDKYIVQAQVTDKYMANYTTFVHCGEVFIPIRNDTPHVKLQFTDMGGELHEQHMSLTYSEYNNLSVGDTVSLAVRVDKESNEIKGLEIADLRNSMEVTE